MLCARLMEAFMLLDDFALCLLRAGPSLDPILSQQDAQLAAGLDRLEAAARQVAPILRLHPNDHYLPAPVEFFLPRVELGIWDRPSGSFDRVLGEVRVGRLSMDALLGQERFGQQSVSSVLGVNRRTDWRLYIYGARKPSNVSASNWNRFCEETRRGQIESAACYVHIRRPVDDSGALDIQYWLFYPYNGRMGSPPFSAEHEGDWEHVTIRVSDDGQPIKAYFSAHDGEGNWYRLGQSSMVTFVGDSHPVVYSAWHSHASYPTTGVIVREGSIIDLPDDVTADGGPEIDVSQRLRLIALADTTVQGQPWVHFSGSWGRASSPYGPAFQASWYAEPEVRRR